ncbi:hypothetical protein F2Q70_00031173 [Brassica cretica]|uniref:Uncharacterized protein n=1 Tax=Brassica cretica TaxID=69181 RepID=A0A8S9FFK4_BRACR|nr:hypothetical protein F2Q70_00031173 [Brassica cretica]
MFYVFDWSGCATFSTQAEGITLRCFLASQGNLFCFSVDSLSQILVKVRVVLVIFVKTSNMPRPRHEPARPASTTVLPVNLPATSALTRASSPGEHDRVTGRLAGELDRVEQVTVNLTAAASAMRRNRVPLEEPWLYQRPLRE